MDAFNLLLSGWIFFIFGTICIISIFFTFSIKIYLQIEEKLNFCIFSDRLLTPLDKRIDWVNNWLTKYHKITGSFLIILSLVDLRLAFDIINNL